MPYYKFEESDIFYNRIKAHPKKEFFVYDSAVYLDNQSQISGAFTGSVPNVPPGYANLYELNVDRTSSDTGRYVGPVDLGFPARSAVDTGLIYPFVIKDGSLSSFRTVTTASFNEDFLYGDMITGSYPLSASITRELFKVGATSRNLVANKINALSSSLNFYAPLSRHYLFSSSFANKNEQDINLISLPSIFYGSSIKKGTVNLKYYITGTLIGELSDENYNGELIQVGPAGSTNSGSVAGVVLYNEGFLILTGSWNIGETQLDYNNYSPSVGSSWLYYAVGANDSTGSDSSGGLDSRLSASYNLDFQGTQHVPVVTMLASAPRGELNYSSNPTFIDQSSNAAFTFVSSSAGYAESSKQGIKNIVKSPYTSPTGTYEPQTYISKIGIFDKDKNLIGIAKMATPVKKTEERDLTFKLKLDF
jgi:hypothetical protein